MMVLGFDGWCCLAAQVLFLDFEASSCRFCSYSTRAPSAEIYASVIVAGLK